MNSNEEKEDERTATASSWLIPVEPEVEIKESEKTLVMDDGEEENVEEHSSDSEEEEEDSGIEAVKELESVLVDKMCEVCGNFFQTFELVNAEQKKPLLSTCETCSYYITPPVAAIYGSNDSNKYSCDKCPKTFVRKDKLTRHEATHLDSKPFCCNICDKSYKRHDKLTEHMKLVHADVVILEKCVKDKCITCGAVDNIITLNVGENEAELIKLCEACNLSRQEEISKISQNGSKVFPCDLCLRSFTRRDHATRHRLSHLNVKPFECYICKKSFSRNDRLLRHMKIHPGAKPFSCKVCSKSFSDREKLKTHLLTHPKLNGRGYSVKCEVCQKELRDKDRLRKHMLSHEKKCDVCEKVFKTRGALLVHQKSHSDVNLCKCDTCGLVFKTCGALLAHQKTHFNEHFKCDTCDMVFKRKDIYKRHLLFHYPGKTYSCKICPKTFKRKDKLQTHTLVHVDYRPFTCNICNSSFKRKDKYIRHLRQVHRKSQDEILFLESSSNDDLSPDDNLPLDEKEITCGDCGLKFLCEDDLTEHKMAHYR